MYSEIQCFINSEIQCFINSEIQCFINPENQSCTRRFNVHCEPWPSGECVGSRCADFVILNKMDQLTSEDQKDSLVAIVSALNPLAKVLPSLPVNTPPLGRRLHVHTPPPRSSIAREQPPLNHRLHVHILHQSSLEMYIWHRLSYSSDPRVQIATR